MKSLRICHVIGQLGIGGAEKQFVNLLNEMTTQGMDVAAVILASPKQCPLAATIDPAVNVYYLPVRLSRFPLEVFRLAALFRRIACDVVHAHMFWSSLYAALAAKFAGVDYFFTTEHGMNPWKKRFHYFAETVITQIAIKRICVSKDILDQRRDIDRISADKLFFLPNGTPAQDYKFRNWSGRTPKLVSVGRCIAAKDYPNLVNTARLLRDKGIVFDWSICGDGPDLPTISALISENGLENCVHMRGSILSVLDTLYAADIFVMTSMREGQPVALLEAMSTGMPIISTAVGGIPDTVDDGIDAMLVPAKDHQALANTIINIINNQDLANRLGLAAFQRHDREFSVSSIVRQLQCLYNNETVSGV